MVNTKEQSAGVDQAAELEEWYAELGRIWDEQKTVGEGTDRWKQLCRDEEELAVVIAELEAGIQKPAVASEVPLAVTEPVTELRTDAADVLAGTPVTSRLTAQQKRERAAQQLQHGCDMLAAKLDAATGRPEAMTAAFESVASGVVLAWAKGIAAQVSLDGRGMLTEQWSRRIELWVQALIQVRQNAAGLGKRGTEGACAQAERTLQDILLVNPAAGEHPGKRLGLRNKPAVMTDDGKLQTIRPISGDANSGTWSARRYSNAG